MNTPGSNLNCNVSETKSVKSFKSDLKSGLSGKVTYKSPFTSEVDEKVNLLEKRIVSLEESLDIILQLLKKEIKDDN